MRISDWSSDVCSSDLPDEVLDAERFGVGLHPVGDFPAQVEGRSLGGHADGVAEGAVAGAAQGVLGGLARARGDRKSVVSGKSVSVRVDLGGRRIIKKKMKTKYEEHKTLTNKQK